MGHMHVYASLGNTFSDEAKRDASRGWIGQRHVIIFGHLRSDGNAVSVGVHSVVFFVSSRR
jgi:hypothetical protein